MNRSTRASRHTPLVGLPRCGVLTALVVVALGAALTMLGASPAGSGAATKTAPYGMLPAFPTDFSGSRVAITPTYVFITQASTLAGPAEPGKEKFDAIRWTSWTHTQATGDGFIYVGSCVPNCDNGLIKPYPIAITLSHPKRVHKQLIFDTLTLTFTGAHPRTLTGFSRGRRPLPTVVSHAIKFQGPPVSSYYLAGVKDT